MSTAAITHRSRDDLRKRRRDLLGSLGMTIGELEEFAKTHALSPEERAALDELRSIDFLLDDGL